MNQQAAERLFGYAHALDEPGVVFMAVGVASMLLLSPMAIWTLARAGIIKGSLKHEIVTRTLAWGFLAPLVIIPVLAGALWTMLLFTLISLACYREFARATGHFRIKPLSACVVVGILLLNFAALDHWYGLFVALPALMLIMIVAVAILRDQPKGYVQRVGMSALALLLFGTCLAHLSYFANDAHYRSLLLIILLCVGMNDIFAFCVGKTLGGPKLAPTTSPGKTISGALGAVVLTTALFFALGRVVFAGSVLHAPVHLLAMGAIISIAGILGDLTISSIKRDVGVKDMGNIIPGHGGVLDRCNSLLLSAPAIFHYIGYFQGVGDDQFPRIFTSGL